MGVKRGHMHIIMKRLGGVTLKYRANYSTTKRMMLKDIKDMDTSSKRSPQSAERLVCAKRFIEFEREYLSQLNTLEENFRGQLVDQSEHSANAVLSSSEIDSIFSTSKDIHAVTTDFVMRLAALDDDNTLANIGSIFVEFVPRFQCYTSYTSGHKHSQKVLAEFLKSNERFHNFVGMSEICEGSKLTALLKLPLKHLDAYLDALLDLKSKIDSAEEKQEAFAYDMAINGIDELTGGSLQKRRKRQRRSVKKESRQKEKERGKRQGDEKGDWRRWRSPPSLKRRFGSPRSTDRDTDSEQKDEMRPQVPRLNKSLSKHKSLLKLKKRRRRTKSDDGDGDEIDSDGAQSDGSDGESKKTLQILAKAKALLAALKELPKLKGWIEKRSHGFMIEKRSQTSHGFMSGWSRRYLAVADCNIFYSKSSFKTKSASSAMSSGVSCLPLIFVQSVKVKESKCNRQFVVKTKKHSKVWEYVFRAETTRERDDWVAGINNHQKHLGKLVACQGILLEPLSRATL